MTTKLGARAAKAYMSAAIALTGALALGLNPDEVDGVVRLTAAEVLSAIGTALTAFVAVYFVPNGEDPDPDTSTPDPYEAGQPDGSHVRILPADEAPLTKPRPEDPGSTRL